MLSLRKDLQTAGRSHMNTFQVGRTSWGKIISIKRHGLILEINNLQNKKLPRVFKNRKFEKFILRIYAQK